MRSIALIAALVTGALALTPACDRGAPPPPPADPAGRDLVEGAFVAAAEPSGALRIYKIVHVEEDPEPIGRRLHMVAYDPTVRSFDEAVALQRRGGLTVALDHVDVQQQYFLPRDHRVIAHEPVSPAEEQAFREAVNRR